MTKLNKIIRRANLKNRYRKTSEVECAFNKIAGIDSRPGTLLKNPFTTEVFLQLQILNA